MAMLAAPCEFRPYAEATEHLRSVSVRLADASYSEEQYGRVVICRSNTSGEIIGFDLADSHQVSYGTPPSMHCGLPVEVLLEAYLRQYPEAEVLRELLPTLAALKLTVELPKINKHLRQY